MQSIVYVGMDVHKESLSLCALNSTTGEILGETKCALSTQMLCKFIASLKQKCQQKYAEEVTVITGYEAGCLGYSWHNELEKLDIECHIMAPTTMYRSTKNKTFKNDHQDAKMIARNLANGTYRSVYVPDAEDNSIKEFIRLRKSFKSAQKKIKQQISAFTLRLGFSFPGKSKWTRVHLDWLDHLPLTGPLKMVLEEYLVQYHELAQKIARYDQELADFSHSDKYEQPVQKLRCFKGIDTVTGMVIHVEISDFSRFPTSAAFAAYLGLTPYEHSSGNSINRGAITKQGNSVVRTTLVECAQSLVRGKIGRKSKRVNARQQGQPVKVISYADRAIERLQRKFYRMTASGKPYNVAIVAVARELACFIWGMETERID